MKRPARRLLHFGWLITLVCCGSDPAATDDVTDARPHMDAEVDEPQIPCSTTEDCPFGFACEDGLCTSHPTSPSDQGCHEDNDCASDQRCAVATGTCVPRPVVTPPPEQGPCTSGETRRCGVKIGACEYGTETCVDGQWSGSCVDQVGPRPEQCDGLDNDCNGLVDEDFVLGDPCSAGNGACVTSGVIVCDPADPSKTTCSTSGLDPTGRVELCGNGLDDDCDGVDDNGFEDLGGPCEAGVGACAGPGVYICSNDQLSLRCSGTPGTPGPRELCGNNIDDDCDGQTDEGFGNVGQACTLGIPPCISNGTFQCSPDGTVARCELPPSAGELCNGLDDDSDFCIDEDFDVGQPCSVGLGACVQTGTKVCSADQTTTVCSGTPLPAGTELCANGIDDDCDGERDEGFTDLGTPCSAGRGVCEREGTTVCSTDRLSTVCDAVPSNPSPEICDNLDNDCDGGVDEGCDDDFDDYCDAQITIIGTPAICPLTTNGLTRDCNDDDPSIHPGAPEICFDNVDQDCDGNPTNGCPNCNPNDTDGDGFSQCAGDCYPSNGNAYPGAPEVCDGLDTDCNPATLGQCDDGERCDWAQPPPDVCGARLVCALSPSMGISTCTTICNYSETTAVAAGGCEADEACSLFIYPTANVHGCAPATPGALSPGAACTTDGNCRSTNCFADSVLGQTYCTDYCAHDSYCGGGTNCQTVGVYGHCRKPLPTQTRSIGSACPAGTEAECVRGAATCINNVCSQLCCSTTQCPGGQNCTIEGNWAPAPSFGLNVAPVCVPNAEAGPHNLGPGASCTSNGQCQSEFCDVNLGICVNLCCDDTTCGGLTCDLERMYRSDGGFLFGHVCINQSPADPLEAM